MPLDCLEVADSVAVMFKKQQNDQKHKTVIHGQTDDPILCPVKQWACLVNWIWTYSSTTEDTSVCTVWHNNRKDQITLHQVITTLRPACATIGSAHLAFKPEEIGMHSLCLGAAIEMYLVGVLVYTIILIGRWSSDAFLHYILKQVEQFSKDIAQKILMHQSFCTIPDVAPLVVSNKDPRQRNHSNNAETRRNIGCDMSHRVQLPAFSLFN